jgi:pSer/pThr/pTyr-binding forkhead associated (FHA) protein
MFAHRPMASSTQPGLQSVPAAPSPSSRPSRLRGLSYLRNYTHHHRQSRDTPQQSSDSASPSTSPANDSRSGSASSNTSDGVDNTHGGSLTRSLSASEVSSPRSSSAAPATSRSGRATRTTNRLTLVNWASAPLHHPAQPTIPENPASPQDAASTTSLNSPSATTDPAAQTLVSSASNPVGTTTSNGTAADDAMTRTRSATVGDVSTTASMSANPSADATGQNGNGSNQSPDFMPSIRFSAYYDPRSTRPSLTFPPVTRTLPTGSESIRVGRYSERDSQTLNNVPANQPSAAPVGFKSKVVSRRHCEFWYENGKWYIKDVKSSSGTFLNHIRLSPPSQESKAFAVNDGDIVQLGIDFKGGEEMIFRCVKMRVELNRGWQNKPNTFNVAAHKRLRTLANPASSGSNSQDCSICLNSVAPCQSLFVAPCSHTWHFKCIKSLLMSPQYPVFICPNCRAGADLEADVEESSSEWQQLEEEAELSDKQASDSQEEPSAASPLVPTPPETEDSSGPSSVPDGDPMDMTVHVTSPESPGGVSQIPGASSPLPINNPASGSGRGSLGRDSRTPSPPVPGTEGPITPRNDAGPWVFDGSAGSASGPESTTGMRSLNEAADMSISRTAGDGAT